MQQSVGLQNTTSHQLKKKIHSYLKELEKISGANLDFILVAGHAVSLWVEYYEKRSIGLQKLGAFESKDLDLLCRKEDFEQAVKLYPEIEKLDSDTLFGIARIGEDLTIDFMHSVYGMSVPRIFENSITVSLDNVPVKVSDPIDLFQAKLANSISLDQENRQDVFQLKALSEIVPMFLSEFAQLATSGVILEKPVVERAESLLKCLDHEEVPAQLWMSQIDPHNLFPKFPGELKHFAEFKEEKLDPFFKRLEQNLDHEL